jgi:O-antigen ligase
VAVAGARSAAAAYLVVLLGMAAAWRPRAALWVVAGAVLLGAAAVVILGSDVMGEVWLARGLSFRDVVWQQVLAAYEGCNALIGCGLAAPPHVELGSRIGERAHSILLATLYYQGLLGLIVFVAGLGWLLWRGLRHPASPDHRGWACMLGYALLANLTSGDHILVRGELFWLYFWLPAMVTAAMSRGTPPPARPSAG